MNALLYYLCLPFIYAISILPFWWLYRLSDLLKFVVFDLFGYRKSVVRKNLRNSFPEKSEAELKTIEDRFYRWFCDLILETVKSLTITPESLRKRLSFSNLEIVREHYNKGQSIIIVMGHWGNWELGGARFAIEPIHRLHVIYHPLKNPYFNRLIYYMRTRLGNRLYAMKDTLRDMIRDKELLTATAFIADQTPSPRGAHWMTFMNQETPVFMGTGKIAHKLNYPVIYASVDQPKRGYYHIALEELESRPAESDHIAIVERFTRKLESDIRSRPEIWLWSHKRWKHKRPSE